MVHMHDYLTKAIINDSGHGMINYFTIEYVDRTVRERERESYII